MVLKLKKEKKKLLLLFKQTFCGKLEAPTLQFKEKKKRKEKRNDM